MEILRCFRIIFQSTLPRGSDFVKVAKSCLMLLFQSTLPRGSDWDTPEKPKNDIQISIHAPSRERQSGKLHAKRGQPISIHAPSRERLPNLSLSQRINSYFNPRSLAGATHVMPGDDERAAISIHAPSRERQCTIHCKCIAWKFQSTLPRGSD